MTTSPLASLLIPGDPSDGTPRYRWLYEGIRSAIVDGRVPAGARLPSTRTLAAQLKLSRNTVANAFDQLLAEGYLEARYGSGTFVSRVLPEELIYTTDPPSPPSAVASRSPSLSRRGARIAVMPPQTWQRPVREQAFRPGLPDLDAFPTGTWRRLAARRWDSPPAEFLGYGDLGGYRPLREAIAAHLQAARAVACRPEQVIVVGGTQPALDLAARLLIDPQDGVWVEDPGYGGARSAFAAAGADLVPVPVDGQGIQVAAGISRSPGARLAYVTPSHQYPSGVTMSLARRFELLAWARAADAWIVEDDYDSDFRYTSRPLESLQGLDRDGRVIYVGTFSKVLFPSLRLGYLVVPDAQVDSFLAARARTHGRTPTTEQAILADFMTEGHFARHVRRMRGLYQERAAVLCEEAGRELSGALRITPPEAGMHTVGWLPPGTDDRALSLEAAGSGIVAPSISEYSITAAPAPGLILGFAAVPPEEIRRGVRTLAAASGWPRA